MMKEKTVPVPEALLERWKERSLRLLIASEPETVLDLMEMTGKRYSIDLDPLDVIDLCIGVLFDTLTDDQKRS